jgi:hypothetical protein
MSEVPLDKLEPIAAQLGAAGVDWAIDRLCKNKPLVGLHAGHGDDDVERLLFESALHLRDWLQMYPRLEEMTGEEYPSYIDDVTTGLDELIPFLAKDVEQPKASRPPDSRLRLCAAVCLGIWRDVHGKGQPYSPKLWAACEAYWVACGHPENPSGHVKKWQRLLEWAQRQDHHITTPK